jgi:dienelactone hydrolase
MIFGGSEGGLDPRIVLAASLLAGHGYPTLALAYFQGPGVPTAAYSDLPPKLFKVPLENFQAALDWLAKQPGVKPDRIFVSGTSRGSEAALLLGGLKDPDQVFGVIANVPSSAVVCTPDMGAAGSPAWSYKGNARSCAANFNDPYDKPIPVEEIEGPLFLDCGMKDKVWDSCPYMEAIVRRLRYEPAGHRPVTHRPAHEHAGHGIGLLVPYNPSIQRPSSRGDSEIANQVSTAELWPRLLAFLKNRSKE